MHIGTQSHENAIRGEKSASLEEETTGQLETGGAAVAIGAPLRRVTRYPWCVDTDEIESSRQQ